MRLLSERGSFCTRATSLIAAFGAIVPKVMICATSFAAVLFDHIVQYVGTAVLIKIDIDIGQGDTVGIQETLEQQVVLDRVDIGNTQANRPRTEPAAEPRPGPTDTPSSRAALDKVPYDKEVTRKTHPFYSRKLVIQTLQYLLVQFTVTAAGPFESEVLQVEELLGDHQ